MLKQRIITALLLVAIVLAALFAANPVYWRALISLVVLAGFFEWLRFCELKTLPEKVVSYCLFGAALFIFQQGYLAIGLVLSLACVLWVCLITFTLTDALNFFHQKWLKLFVGIFILASGAWLIIEIKNLANGPLWIVGFIGTVAAADIGAYFTGKRFGKRKLAPKVSPGKTVEGFLGGLVLVAMVAAPVVLISFSARSASMLLVTIIITAVASVAGDLFESKLKRHVGLKDSSQLLPGHGGMLDRIDGILCGSFFFSSGLFLLGYLG